MINQIIKVYKYKIWEWNRNIWVDHFSFFENILFRIKNDSWTPQFLKHLLHVLIFHKEKPLYSRICSGLGITFVFIYIRNRLKYEKIRNFILHARPNSLGLKLAWRVYTRWTRLEQMDYDTYKPHS